MPREGLSRHDVTIRAVNSHAHSISERLFIRGTSTTKKSMAPVLGSSSGVRATVADARPANVTVENQRRCRDCQHGYTFPVTPSRPAESAIQSYGGELPERPDRNCEGPYVVSHGICRGIRKGFGSSGSGAFGGDRGRQVAQRDMKPHDGLLALRRDGVTNSG